MKKEHAAIISAAKRDGLHPMEMAAELLCHDLLESALTQMKRHEVAFSKMTEKQQDACISDMQAELKKSISVASKIIASAGTEAVTFTLKSMKIDTKLTVTGTVDADDPNRHILTDKAHDKSDILLVLYPRDYFDGLDAIQGEKDQKALPLDGEEGKKPKATRGAGPKKAGDIAAKVIELPPALIEQAEAFVRNIQTATHAGIQNQFKINFDKAEALLQALQERGVVTEKDEQGNRTLVRVKAEPAATVATEDKPAIPDAELYEHAKAKVVADQEVSAGGLAVFFDLTDERAATLMDELEMQGVISEENDLGGREVLMVA